MTRFFICVVTCASVLGMALMAEDCSAEPDGKKETKRTKNQAGEQTYPPLIGGVRAKVDPKDNVERILVLSPRGPIVIEVQLNRDGQPFRVLREKLVDDMLKAADTNQDG